MDTGKKWRSNHTAWQQVHNWTNSENSIWYVVLAWWPTPMTTWPLPLTSTQSTSTQTPECMCVVSFLCQRIVIHAHAPHGSSRESCVHLSSHPHALMKWATLFRLCCPFSPNALPVALLPLLPALEARRQPAAHSAQREYGLFDETYLHTQGREGKKQPNLTREGVKNNQTSQVSEKKQPNLTRWRRGRKTQTSRGGGGGEKPKPHEVKKGGEKPKPKPHKGEEGKTQTQTSQGRGKSWVLCPSFIPSTCAHDVCGSPSPLISPFSSSFTCRTPSTSSPWSS